VRKGGGRIVKYLFIILAVEREIYLSSTEHVFIILTMIVIGAHIWQE